VSRRGDELRVRRRTSGKLIGPFLATTAEGKVLHTYTFTEIVVCDWVIDKEDWERRSLMVPGTHYFKPGTVTGIIMSAWPCSITGDGYQDAGWAIDSWDAHPKSEGKGDMVEITMVIAARGKGTRYNRIGYSWTAYVTP
jgi:hypothetical protein